MKILDQQIKFVELDKVGTVSFLLTDLLGRDLMKIQIHTPCRKDVIIDLLLEAQIAFSPVSGCACEWLLVHDTPEGILESVNKVMGGGPV